MHEGKENKCNIRDVAKIAGVSPATVSRVFNHSEPMKEDTRQKVLAAAQSLGYLPRTSLANDQTVLVLNIPSFGNPFYSDIIQGAKSAAAHNDCVLIVTEENFTDKTLPEYLALLRQLNAKGLIVLNYLTAEMESVISRRLPLVQCCEFDNGSSSSCVGIDNVHAAEKAVKHLISQGRTKIAFLNGPSSFKYSEFRLRGYQKALQECGIPFRPDWCVNLPDITVDYAYATATQLLTGSNLPDAIFAAADICAAGVIKAAIHKKLRVPSDIMVVGFDNIDISSMTMPSITTINQPRFQLGFVACNLLCEKLKNPEAERQTILMEAELVIRESTSKIL